MSERLISRFARRLHAGPPLLLDAGMGSELDRRGLPTTLPLWSARGLLERPELVRQIHLDNLRAGADVITTNTFRTTGWTLRKAGLDASRAAELDALAVRLAMEARSASGRVEAMIAGSMAPLDDCYLPVFATPADVALAEHRAQARQLAAAGVDVILVETMPTAAEAAIALQAAAETGLPMTVGFVCELAATDGPVRLLSGETLDEAMRRVSPLRPVAIFVNCAPPPVITAALRELAALTPLPLGAYANAGRIDDVVGWSPDERVTGERYAAHAGEWLALGARVVGGCCGTDAGHTAALRALIDGTPVA